MEYVRVFKNVLQTPKIFLEHPHSGREVILIGTIHLAEEEYFKAIQGYLWAFAGQDYKVLFESVEGRSGRQKARSDKSRLMRFLEKIDIKSMLEKNSITLQRSMIAYPPGSSICDITCPELEFKMGISIEEMAEKMIAAFVIHLCLMSLSKRIWVNVYPSIAKYTLVNIRKKNQHFYKELIDGRNQIAFQGIKKHLATNNIVSVWGASHLPGITQMLEHDGFEVKQINWLSAIHG